MAMVPFIGGELATVGGAALGVEQLAEGLGQAVGQYAGQRMVEYGQNQLGNLQETLRHKVFDYLNRRFPRSRFGRDRDRGNRYFQDEMERAANEQRMQQLGNAGGQGFDVTPTRNPVRGPNRLSKISPARGYRYTRRNRRPYGPANTVAWRQSIYARNYRRKAKYVY